MVKKVLVLMGGTSEEREVSLKSGQAVVKALQEKGYQVESLDLNPGVLGDIEKIKPDVVFIALHGRNGEDGTVQGYLDLLGIPYTGSGVAASAIGMDKILTKKILCYEGLPTAEFEVIRKRDFNRDSFSENSLIARFGLPIVVKPPTQGSSVGTTIVRDKNDLIAAIEKALVFGDEVLLERFIAGTELTVAIIGNDEPVVLPVIEITAENEYYDYESKYTPGMSSHIIPARIADDSRELIEGLAKKAYQALKCRGFSRIDFILDQNGKPYILENNTIPGMTATSLIPDAARAAGINFPELLEKIIEMAEEK
ncbi:MAG: D-alanine--D-alanine ligase [Syntrophomonadaceae bacterium]|nr:D-alanine--D-alanine ligase [Syntrophomonadaceae bacterium]